MTYRRTLLLVEASSPVITTTAVRSCVVGLYWVATTGKQRLHLYDLRRASTQHTKILLVEDDYCADYLQNGSCSGCEPFRYLEAYDSTA